MQMILRGRGRRPGPTQTFRAERQRPEDAAAPVGGEDNPVLSLAPGAGANRPLHCPRR
jgi:hypothetical protein